MVKRSGRSPDAAACPRRHRFSSQQYAVSAQPVKSALLVLQTEGLVEGHQGRGVFVVDRAARNGKAPSP